MHGLQLLKGGRDLPATHCKKAPNKNGKWDIIHHYQANHPNPASSLSFKTWPWKLNARIVLCWGGMHLVASENGSHQVALAAHCSARCFHTRICSWHLTNPPLPGSLSAALLHNVQGIQEWGIQWPGWDMEVQQGIGGTQAAS